ncbi:MAG: hypothetical protein WBA25_05900, partial [Jannaschia sp.]
MQPIEQAKKFTAPSLTVATAAIAIDLYFILKGGKSPAYIDIQDITSILSLDIFYILCIFTLSFLIWMIPFILLAISFNLALYLALRWPFTRTRASKLFFKFSNRRKINTDVARKFAKHIDDKELLEKLNKRERSSANSFQMLPIILFVLLAFLIGNSSASQPNFLMKVCSISEPIQPCWRYPFLVSLIFASCGLFAALNGYFYIQLSS